MKYPSYKKEIAALLQREDIISVDDFHVIMPGVPMTSVYARIRELVQEGRLSVVGKGKYVSIPKPTYRPEITPWMQECASVMRSELVGVNSCITERDGNLEVEVDKADVSQTVEVLKQHFEKVMYRKDAKLLAEKPNGFVLVGRMVSEAPTILDYDVAVPSPEKELVDAVCRKEDASAAFQRMLEVYPINKDRLRRYAARRGVSQEVESYLLHVDQERVNMFASIQRYLATTKIVRAWVFGSFSRCEETPESDLDLLVEYDKAQSPSLLTVIHYRQVIERIIQREVDLVENGYLKPFAHATAEHDKYLLYAR